MGLILVDTSGLPASWSGRPIISARAQQHVAQAGVLVVANVVFNAGVAAVVALNQRQVARPVGEQRPEAVAVVVGEGHLRTGVRALAANDHA